MPYFPWLVALFLLAWATPGTGLLLAQNAPNGHNTLVVANHGPDTVAIDPTRITLARDRWGVPHIFAPTDAEVAYGLGWAQAEDDFETVQRTLSIAKGLGGQVLGMDGVGIDYVMQLLDIPNTVAQKLDTALSPAFKRVCLAHLAAVNRWAELHPEEVLHPDLFPATLPEVIQGYALTMNLFSGLPFVLQNLREGTPDDYEEGFVLGGGSNALALTAPKTADGKTYLVVNSHQPLEGLFSWYEAHLHSQEGWHMVGGVFPGGAMIFHGVNPALGWAATFNWPDLVDHYRLTTRRLKGRLHYRLDGQWLPLQKRRIRLKAKVLGITIPVLMKAYTSAYGPTIKTKRGFYALRNAAQGRIQAPEVIYNLNKVRTLEAWEAEMRKLAIGNLNWVVATQQGELLYLHNMLMPQRTPGFAYRKTVQGDTSATLWQHLHPYDDFPKVRNPPCGYIFNTNNTPFNATCPQHNLDPAQYDTLMGLQREDNNRSRRLQTLMQAHDTIGWATLKRIKYDRQYPDHGAFLDSLRPMLEQWNPSDFPRERPVLERLQAWNRSGHPGSIGATHALLVFDYVFNEINGGSRELEVGLTLDSSLAIRAMRHTKRHLLKHFGTLDVPLGQLQRHTRGTVDLPHGGLPDVIATTLAEPHGKRGRYRPAVGDSYIVLARYGPNGLEHLETVNAYGSSNRPTSPHYTSQMRLFVNQQTKAMPWSKDDALSEAVERYHPLPGSREMPPEWGE